MTADGLRRAHEMPFGAQIEPQRTVRFRLWAPGQRRVLLSLEDESRTLPMQPRPEGWFELRSDEAAAGSRYLFVLEDGTRVPDPASRFQPQDVHGPSRVVDPARHRWQDGNWRGRPWEEAVLYELHVGSFTPQGTFDAAADKLDHLARLGVTALELMPVADFPGARNWGYDGVLPFAPDSRYGPPEALKRFVESAHRHGLMVLLDVVYNHFGPEGNYLHLYAPPFFHQRHRTPWGAAINFDGEGSRVVREFFVHHALYWLEEYNLDGLRLDAVHAIHDDSRPSFLEQLARTVRAACGPRRHVHLVLENDDNRSSPLRAPAGERSALYDAQWNDDFHHAMHVLLTGETGGYYADYAEEPARHLARALAEGFAYQGQASAYRGGVSRGEPSRDLPPTAFVQFLQNHDQVGNRAFGERLASLADENELRCALGILLLAPQPPLLFMGEEYGCRQPFCFFCDLGPQLAEAVAHGRRQEFARFPEFADPAAREGIPDPGEAATFESARLDWDAFDAAPHRRWLELYRRLLELRRSHIVPRLAGAPGGAAHFEMLGRCAFEVRWPMGDGSKLTVQSNLSRNELRLTRPAPGRLLWSGSGEVRRAGTRAGLDAWTAAFYLDEPSVLERR